ncbi:mitochondrial protein Pet127-domain-containing protein [Xylaria grammica]|nr:mitochondrial protein Pet127-domain-containing protein [Xylaria grammica]
MLRLGRRRLYRLTSPHVCASCLAISHPTSAIFPRRIVASHHARLLSTTLACREADTPPPSSAATDVTADRVSPPPPQKKKKKKKPSNEASKAAVSPETDTERQLKVLQGALSALKNVLSTQGVDVSQIPAMHSDTHSPDTTSTPKSTAKAKPKPKHKLKANAEKKGEKAVKATAKTAQPDGAVEPPAPGPKAAHPKTRADNDDTSEKPHPKSKLRTKNRATKSATTPPVVRRIKPKQKGRPETSASSPKPANLGVPFAKMADSRTKSTPTAPRKLPDKVHPNELSLVPIQTSQPDVPSLSYGLERVLFNPGIYQLQDPRSRVYNFHPYLSEIMPVNEFDFNALKEYVTSSKDTTLISIAKQNQKKYTGSTSSMTSMLAHFHYLLSAWRSVNVSMLSRGFIPDSMQYTRIMRAPAAIFLHWKDGTYAIDADKEFDTANILSMLGKSMEKLLTLSTDEYERYRRGNSDQITEEERNAEEAFHYTGFQDFMMRSQLDAYDSRVPGTGMFDLKTRAVISIRMDAKGYEKGLGYEIRERFGQWESYEREYYDMIRSAFLKYSLQVRMGRMDGIFVAFHNTQRIFGFQYIPLTEMDLALHGTDNRQLGDHEFKISLKLLNELLDRATQKWPEQSLRLHFETRVSTGAPFMYFFAEPSSPEEIAAVQNAGKASVEAFERDMLGLAKRAAEEDVETSITVNDVNEEDLGQVAPSPAQEIDSFAAWQEARQMVEEAMGDDEHGVGLVREAIGDALEQSGILRARSLAESHEYVSALLGALTGRTSSERDAATVEPNEEEAVDEDDTEEQVTEQTQELDQSPPPTLPDSETSPTTPYSTLDQRINTEGPESVQPSQKNINGLSPDQDERGTSADRADPESSSMPLGGSIHPGDPQATFIEEMTEEPKGAACGSIETATTESHAGKQQEDLEERCEEDGDDEEASAAELENDIGPKPSSEDVGSSALEPLKSLIMRMARRIDEQPVSDMSNYNHQDDASKLKEFERILGRLISHARTEQINGENRDSIQDQDSSESTAPNAQGEGTPQPAIDEQTQPSQEKEGSELLALTLTIKNKVNGAYVDRPNSLKTDDDWTVEYEIQEVKQPRANTIYNQLKERRRKTLADTGDKEYEWYKMFAGNLKKYTQDGRDFRKKEAEITEGQPVHIVGTKGPVQWSEAFRRQPNNPVTSDEEPDRQL